MLNKPQFLNDHIFLYYFSVPGVFFYAWKAGKSGLLLHNIASKGLIHALSSLQLKVGSVVHASAFTLSDTTSHISKHSNNQQKGWKKIPESFTGRIRVEESASTSTQSTYPWKRERVDNQGDYSLRLGSTLPTMLFVPTEAMSPAFTSEKLILKGILNTDFMGQKIQV